MKFVTFDHICLKRKGKQMVFMLASGLAIVGQELSSPAQTLSLNVTNFGARGDAINISVTTFSNTFNVTTTNLLSSADVGKVIEIFGAGHWNTWTNNDGLPEHTNISDLVAWIKNVSNGTNITLDRLVGNSTNNAVAIYGTQCAGAFQNAFGASSNSIINVPAGNYLLIPPDEINTNSVFSDGFDTRFAVQITTGGMHLLGAGAGSTRLIGLGAWQYTTNDAVTRGSMFGFIGPITNDAPIIFEGLTFDGGVANGRTSYAGWPARGDGDGWDCTHHALYEDGQAPWNALKTITNCNFVHWRGEMFISAVGFPYPATNFDNIINCNFQDGNASGININFSHDIMGCSFSNLVLTAEIYEGYMSGPCIFSNNICGTNISNGFTLLGAQGDHVQPTYTFINNDISGLTGINLSEAQNVIIKGNHFHDILLGSCIYTPVYGAQSINPATNNNFQVINNTFTNIGQVFLCGGDHVSTVQNLWFSNNIISTGTWVADGFGNGTNMLFYNNIAVNCNGVYSGQLGEQWYYDDLSNQFPFRNVDDFGAGSTNALSYCQGARLNIHAVGTNSMYYLDDTIPAAIPPGARLEVQNGSGRAEQLYLSASLQKGLMTLTNGFSGMFIWTNGVWELAGGSALVLPPYQLHVVN